MVKFYEHFFDYEYPFPAVSLAYFLRYPNPYATHVLSTDVIDRKFDPEAQCLTTTRLHLKKSKIPPAIYKILPRGFLGGSGDAGQSFILEKSVVDVKEGWMKTETKNLEWTGILSVVEKQLYQRVRSEGGGTRSAARDLVEATKNEGTSVTTTTTLLSRFGQAKLLRKRAGTSDKEAIATVPEVEEESEPKKGFFSTWSTSGLQRSIEMVGLKRTREALGKSKEGMNVVLERLRKGGLVRVLEGMQQDSQRAFGETGPWKQTWGRGQDPGDVD